MVLRTMTPGVDWPNGMEGKGKRTSTWTEDGNGFYGCDAVSPM